METGTLTTNLYCSYIDNLVTYSTFINESKNKLCPSELTCIVCKSVYLQWGFKMLTMKSLFVVQYIDLFLAI